MKIFRHFMRTVVRDKRGQFAGPIIGGLGSLIGSFFGGRKKGTTTTPILQQLPEFGEAKEARGSISELLKGFGQMPGFGAIAPNFAEIFESAKGKVRQTFGGTATSPGINARIKASLARRGVSQGPQTENLLLRSGVEEAGQIGDIATRFGIEEARLGEKGRRDFIGDLFKLSGQKPSFALGSEVVGPQKGIGDVVSSLGSLFGGTLEKIDQRKRQDDLLERLFGGGGPGVGSLDPIFTEKLPDLGTPTTRF